MTLRLDTLLEGSPAYGIVDARDGVLLFRRAGHEVAFNALAVELLEAAGLEYEVIPLGGEADHHERLFLAPLPETSSFKPR